jgi:23S rRNA G2445 N2-methylase RlmL
MTKLELFALVSPGLEQTAKLEIEELVSSKAIAHDQLLDFNIDTGDKSGISFDTKIFTLIHRSQSLRKVALLLAKFKSVEELDFCKLKLNWSDFFPKDFSLKVTVENLKGNDNRIELSRKFLGKLFPFLEQHLKLNPIIDLKKPDIELILYHTDKELFLGIDLCGKELNSRAYRVFVNHAAFKGDFGYHLVRKSKFEAGEKLLVGFAKDGTAAIEAALFANKLIVTPISLDMAYRRIPIFKDIDVKKILEISTPNSTIVSAFDESNQNMIAARKNAALAKTKELINFNRCALEDLEMRYDEAEFERIILQLTTKDEERLNEIYLQVGNLLKQKGTLLVLARKGFELPISNKFKLLSEEEFQRGDSFHKIWLLERK